MHRQRGGFLRLLDRGDAGFHRLLHLLEGAHLDLAHALARDAELARQILERDRAVGERRASKMRRSRSVEHVERAGNSLPTR